MAAGAAGIALTAGLPVAPTARAAMIDDLDVARPPRPPAWIEPEATLDVTELQAQREALLARASVAVKVRIGTLHGLEQQKIAALGYDPKTATTPREIARQMTATPAPTPTASTPAATPSATPEAPGEPTEPEPEEPEPPAPEPTLPPAPTCC